MPASEFFGTLKAMDKIEAPERVLVKGHIEGDRLRPQGLFLTPSKEQNWKASGFALIKKPLSKSCSKRCESDSMRRIRINGVGEGVETDGLNPRSDFSLKDGLQFIIE